MAKNVSAIQIENGLLGDQTHISMQLSRNSKFNDRTAVRLHKS
jgi:hypothetical protein